MTLADLKVGEEARIYKIMASDSLKRRLFDLGFIPDSIVECVLFSPFQSPILYKVKGAFIALRESDAKRIGVKKIEK